MLLCNYFLGMGKKAWLVLGNAIPEVRGFFSFSLKMNFYSVKSLILPNG